MKKIILILILVISISGLYFLKFNTRNNATEGNTPAPTSPVIADNAEPYSNKKQGYSLYRPKGYEISESADETAIVAPGEGPNRGTVWINTEPAAGRTARQIVDKVISDLGEGFNVKTTETMIDGMKTVVADPLPGQDPTRQVFVVRGDTLYRMTFTPNDPHAGKGYEQMEEAYKVIISTFRFTN